MGGGGKPRFSTDKTKQNRGRREKGERNWEAVLLIEVAGKGGLISH